MRGADVSVGKQAFTEKQQSQDRLYVFPYHYLDLVSDVHKFTYGYEHRSYLRCCKELLAPFNNQAILDVGCGDGRFLFELANENARLFGVDHSEKAVEFAKCFCPTATFFAQDIKKLDSRNRFDSIVLIETFEHFIPAERPEIVKKIHELLQPNGKLIVTVPTTNVPLSKRHYEHFTAKTLEDAMRPFFKAEKITGHSKHLLNAVVFSNLVRIGLLLLPLRNLFGVRGYHDFLERFYVKYVEKGKPQECERLIAVFRKA